MFKYISTADQVQALKGENARLSKQEAQTRADLDYVAIMTGVEIQDEEGVETPEEA